MVPENQGFQVKSFSGAQSSVPTASFRSFWMGGFEGADHRNGSGESLDPAVTTGHLSRVEQDYSQLARIGLRTVRESVGWRLTKSADGFDFTRLRRYVAAADKHGIQILWTLKSAAKCHNSGLWDVVDDASDSHGSSGGEKHHVSRRRVLNLPYARALRRWQRRFAVSSLPIEATALQQRKLVCKH